MTGEILGGGDTTDTTIYEYDVFNRMDTMLDGSYEWTFEYNADGQRVSKSNGSQSLEYIWDGNNIVSEKNENNQSTYFQRGLSLLTMEREQDNFKHYYFKNAHGDVTGVVDTRTNTIKYSYDYDAFGNQILNSATNTNIFSSGYNGEVEDTNPFRYAGEYFDRETVMIYLRNRYYIPRYGRFTQQDPIFDGINWYVYCGNSPVNRIDPWGLADYVVVLAAGINSNASDNNWASLENEIQYRMNTQGDNVRFIYVYPYGEGKDTAVAGQASSVLDDTKRWSRDGGNHVNWRITEANVQENEYIIMIGHSGGGVAVIDAYDSMDDYHKSKVTQVVAIGSPQTPVYSGADKTTIITDPNDLIPKFGTFSWGNNAQYSYTVNNGVEKPDYNPWNVIQTTTKFVEYAAFKVHTQYFDTANKAANILNKFWDRAMRR